MTNINTLIIPWGLPAAGKTTFLKSIKGHYIDCDRGNFDELKNLDDLESIVIDILITTNTQFMKVVETLSKYISWNKIIIHFWEENREICLHNDSKRDNLRSAKLTITKAKFEKPDLNIIGEDSVEIVQHETIMF